MSNIHNPILLLKKVIQLLNKQECAYALSGGMAASLYRIEPRLTQDVDITLVAGDLRLAKQIAEEIFATLDLKTGILTEARLIKDPQMNKKRSPVMAFVGRREEKSFGVDFLFETYPWAVTAVKRAIKVDFKFARVPTLSPEDLVVSKAYASTYHQMRFKDLDDIESIVNNTQLSLDYVYLLKQFEALSLFLPRELEKRVPKALARISRAQRRRA